MTNENLGKRAQDWLTEEGFTIEPLKESGFTSLFSFYHSSDSQKFTISQRVDEDKITIAGGVKLYDKDREALQKLDAQTHAKLTRELAWILHNKSIPFHIDEKEDAIQSVSIFNIVYADGMTKDRFMTAVYNLQGSQALMVMHLANYFGTTESTDSRTGTTDHQAVKGVVGTPAMPSSTKCPKCGAALKISGQQFCMECGKKIN